MRVLRATLIQDIQDYIWLLQASLSVSCKKYNVSYLAAVDDAIKWIIEREIEQSYCLFSQTHQRNHPLYVQLYQDIDRNALIPLYLQTKHYIKVPKLYGDNNEIDVRVDRRDLYIMYYNEPAQPLTI